MQTNTDEAIRQLVANIIKDFYNQLDGPFHRGGAEGLNFSVVRKPGDKPACGFRIVTGGSEWQEGISTVRIVSKIGVTESIASGEHGEISKEEKLYRIPMTVEILDGLYTMSRRYVQQIEAYRDPAGRLNDKTALENRFLEEILSYYRVKSKTIDDPEDTRKYERTEADHG
ncbi:MAG: hypothetical protein RDU20_16025 [Desulfomonilaceae bacterium]|nr:hypothetical protein [Desulfomonilaceae bacterium]